MSAAVFRPDGLSILDQPRNDFSIDLVGGHGEQAEIIRQINQYVPAAVTQ